MRNRKTWAGKVVLVAGAVLAGTSPSMAQFDDSHWPGFSGGANKHRSVEAPGPIGETPVVYTGIGLPSPGGISVAANGDLYFKDYSTNYNGTGLARSVVKRINPNTGAVMAESVDLQSVAGDHGGVAVGVDAVYVSNFRGAGNGRIVKLDKTTLAIIAEFTDPSWSGIRGTPLIGNALNANGNVNLYAVDRDGGQILAIDSVTGEAMGAFAVPSSTHVMSQLGPMWTVDGRDVVAYFSNASLGNAYALQDDGNGTLTNLWGFFSGPESFNWWGSGAMSDDGQRIYVTTFNDNNAPSLTAISVFDGSIVWSVPGDRGLPTEFNFFGRPAVVGNSIYCGGAFALIAKFTDHGTSASTDWVRWGPGGGTKPASGPEMTTTSAVQTKNGVYVYSLAQDDGGLGRLDVLHDQGDTFTELFRTDMNGTMRWSLYSTHSGYIHTDGSLWVGGGRYSDAAPGDLYKFTVGGGEPECAPDFNNDGVLNSQDFFDFLNAFFSNSPTADYNNDKSVSSQDFFDFLNDFFEGCPA